MPNVRDKLIKLGCLYSGLKSFQVKIIWLIFTGVIYTPSGISPIKASGNMPTVAKFTPKSFKTLTSDVNFIKLFIGLIFTPGGISPSKT
jgi:hypothetical protein